MKARPPARKPWLKASDTTATQRTLPHETDTPHQKYRRLFMEFA